MAVRIFCNAARHFKNAHIQRYNMGLLDWTKNCTITKSVQLLYVKVYDKDAGWSVQREANVQQREYDETEAPLERNIPRRERLQVETATLNVRENYAINGKGKERDSLVNGANDADTFGDSKAFIDDEVVDEGDLAEEAYMSKNTRRTKKLQTKEYAQLIKEHFKANRVKDAIAVLEIRMLKEDGVKPENYIYNLLISGCAKAGYTRKAFSLFTKMRQRDLKVTGGTYTSLFNACANAPSSADGLARANHLRETMLEKGYEPNVKNYNSMIKAYGRCGDVKTAYLLADEMMDGNMEVTAETFNFLLQACAGDAEFGFRHCLLTWHKMMQRALQPDYYTFNTVLRCVRDCGFGDLESMQQVLAKILIKSQTVPRISSNMNQQKIQAGVNVAEHANSGNGSAAVNAKPSKMLQSNPFKDATTIETKQSNLDIISVADETSTLVDNVKQLETPNLLAARPHLGNLVALSEVRLPHERFLLLGGLTGYLELMKEHKVTPDIATFTTLLEVIPPTNSAEKLLISYIRKIGLKADIDFFNILIKKRSMRFDYEGAKEVLSMIRTAGLQPDIVTYGVLALGCQTQETARELLLEMHNNGVRMNIQILGAMLRQGCAQKAFQYVIEIMQISLDENIKPNDIFLRHLNNFYINCARAIDARYPLTKKDSFKKAHKKFCDKLRLYYEEQGIAGLKLEDAIKKIKERPYTQYSEDDVTGIEPLKNEKLARKQKMRKYIKKIKLQNLRDDEDEHSKFQQANTNNTKSIE